MANEYEDQNEELSEVRGDLTAENNARQLNMRGIIARQRELIAQRDPSEGLDGLDDGVPDDDPDGGMSAAFMPNDDSIKKALDRLPKAVDHANDKFSLKVAGEDKEFTLDELKALASKNAAADKYLAEAAEAKRQADALLASAKQVPISHSEPVQSEVTLTDEDMELARALQVGTEEDAARAIARVRARAVTAPSVNMDEIVARVTDHTTFKADAEWFQKTYVDIFQDERLKKLALQRDDELRAAGDKRPYRERYQSIGEELRTWIGSNPTFSEKAKAKKETLTNIPQASVKSLRQVDEDDEENPASVIANMAKARGQLRI